MKICLHAQFDARKTTGYFSFSNVPHSIFRMGCNALLFYISKVPNAINFAQLINTTMKLGFYTQCDAQKKMNCQPSSSCAPYGYF